MEIGSLSVSSRAERSRSRSRLRCLGRSHSEAQRQSPCCWWFGCWKGDVGFRGKNCGVGLGVWVDIISNASWDIPIFKQQFNSNKSRKPHIHKDVIGSTTLLMGCLNYNFNNTVMYGNTCMSHAFRRLPQNVLLKHRLYVVQNPMLVSERLLLYESSAVHVPKQIMTS